MARRKNLPPPDNLERKLVEMVLHHHVYIKQNTEDSHLYKVYNATPDKLLLWKKPTNDRIIEHHYIVPYSKKIVEEIQVISRIRKLYDCQNIMFLDEQKKEQATTSRFQYIPDGLLERYHTRIVPMLKDTMWIVPSELVWLNARIDGKSRQDFIYYSNESEQQFHLLDTPFWINSGLTNGEAKANKEK